MRLSDAFEAYRRDVINFKGQSHKTEEQHIYTMRSLLKFCGDINLEELSIDLVREWKFELERHTVVGTQYNYLVKLRLVLAHMRLKGEFCLDPNLVYLPKREKPKIEFLTRENIRLLIKVANKPCRGYPEINRIRNQAIISLLFGSGLRVGEICRLDRDFVYNGTFQIYGKGGKYRPGFIDERTQGLINQYLALRKDSNPALFLANQTHSRIRPGNIQRIMRELGVKARKEYPEVLAFKKGIHPHIMRHSFATDFYMNSGDLRSLQAILGHSDANTTNIYTHVTDPHLKAVYEAHHKV